MVFQWIAEVNRIDTWSLHISLSNGRAGVNTPAFTCSPCHPSALSASSCIDDRKATHELLFPQDFSNLVSILVHVCVVQASRQERHIVEEQ